MDTLAFYRKLTKEIFFQFHLFLYGKPLAFNLGNFSSNLWHYEEIGIAFPGKIIYPLIGKFYLVVLFIYNKVELGINLWHFTVVVAHIVVFGFLENLFYPFFRKKFYKCLILWQPAIYA